LAKKRHAKKNGANYRDLLRHYQMKDPNPRRDSFHHFMHRLRMSYSLCRYSQKRGSMLKNRPRRNAVSRGDRAAAVDQAADSARRNIDVAGESAGADVEGCQEVLKEDCPGMDFVMQFSHVGAPN
jgi:hypothetical protein